MLDETVVHSQLETFPRDRPTQWGKFIGRVANIDGLGAVIPHPSTDS